MVTKTGNRAISDSERKNLFDRIAEAHSKHIKFIIVIDEEHSNNTAKTSQGCVIYPQGCVISARGA